MMMKHLWEVKHTYYCNLGNYFDNNCGRHYKTFAVFLEAENGYDMDLNLLFRWDWKEEHERVFTGDVNYRNGQLEMFWIGQRKGIYRYSTVEVCRADEPAILEFLRPRWDHLSGLWAPFNESTEIKS
jgi:hypothetical protein